MRSFGIPSYIRHLTDAARHTNETRTAFIQQRYKELLKGPPEVSVIIPAYNEEKDILQTLYSLAANRTSRSVEIIVVNNNSKDNTEALVRATGVSCINELKQGITAARNAGLAAAIGKYVLNADADTIYPADWIEEMVAPIAGDNKIALTYGRFSLIPTGSTSRFIYFFYEYIADVTRFINKITKDEAMNAYGFNTCFRREQGLQVDGYNHPDGANEDGWLALKLRNKGFGRLYKVTNKKALVWTTDRRLQADGGLIKALVKRAKRILLNKAERHEGL